jgi:hypothetical protein
MAAPELEHRNPTYSPAIMPYVLKGRKVLVTGSSRGVSLFPYI